MKIFKLLFVCTILFACSKPKLGEIGNYQVALGEVKADFYVLMWEQSFNLKKSKVYTSYSNGALHATRGVLSGKVLHGDYKEISLSGALLKVGKFRKGLKDGYWASYNEKGEMVQDLTYSNGDTVSAVRLYNSDGLVEKVILPVKMQKKSKIKAEKEYKKSLIKGRKKTEEGRSDNTGNQGDNIVNEKKRFSFDLSRFKFKKSKKDSAANSLDDSSIEK